MLLQHRTEPQSSRKSSFLASHSAIACSVFHLKVKSPFEAFSRSSDACVWGDRECRFAALGTELIRELILK
jgi:hypothetical protein